MFHAALESVFASVREANGYITQQQPWALKKTDLVRMAAVLRHLHSALRAYATILQPFMPGTMAQLLCALEDGAEPEISGRDNLETVALCQAVYAAAQEHRVVTVREFLSA